MDLTERINELASAVGADIKALQSNTSGGNVGVAVDGGNATTQYTEPALRIDFGKST